MYVAPLFSIAGILLFTTPDWSYGAKLIYAYVTYILMMTIYTAINVPYGAMLGVMTDDSQEKTVFSSFRMFFAYGGSFIALAAWEPLVSWFRGMEQTVPQAWQHAMMVVAAACFVLFLLTFALTRERLKTVSSVSIGKDFRSLLSNRPWWLLIGAALCFNLFCTVRGATVAYYFADIIGFEALCKAESVVMYPWEDDSGAEPADGDTVGTPEYRAASGEACHDGRLRKHWPVPRGETAGFGYET